MVYQEDVMKIVHHFAGLGLDESDVLRRIMSGKKYKDDTFERLRRKYFGNCRARGHSDELAQEVWRQIESFSGYSFCKAHSASFAVESFQSLYLKAYFPLEFMVAVINNFGGFYHPEYYFHEARMNGGIIHAPCANHSQYLTTLKGKDIYIGFVHLHGMERQAAHRIVAERARGGPFRSLEDFINRLPITPDQLDLLIRIGAFRFTGRNKYELMWDRVALMDPKGKWDGALSLFKTGKSEVGSGNGNQSTADEEGRELFPPSPFRLPPSDSPLPTSFEQAFDEIELLGFPLCSPFDLLESKHCGDCITLSARLGDFVGRVVKVLGYYACKKDVRTSRGQLMAFGCWLGQDGHFFDTTHFPEFLKAFPFRGKGIYKIEGKVVEEFGFPSMEVIRMERLAYRKDERY